MARRVLTRNELYEIYRGAVVARAGDLTDFTEGSLHDIIGGTFAIVLNEVSELLVSEFRKTYFDTATGADLEGLAQDHFGNTFSRPVATASTVELTFSRPNNNAGDVIIPEGTAVSTPTDQDGNSVTFETTTAATLTGTTITVSATSTATGANQNVGTNRLTSIDSPLTDTTVSVTNAASSAGGNDVESDAEYRETIRSQIQSLRGATKDALTGAILAIPEIRQVTAIEEHIPVIEYDIGAGAPRAGARFFRYPRPVVYISDENGQSSEALVASATAAIENVRGCGINVEVRGANTISIDWTVVITLNSNGPNFDEFSRDRRKLADSMREYINDLDIGDDFNISDANDHILSIWGAAGTDDLVTFVTNVPVANTVVPSGTKLIAGTISINQ